MNALKSIAISIGIMTLVSCGSTSTVDKATSRNGERPDPATIIEQMDTNEDGKLSKDEVQGPLKNDFDKLDTDSDGFLSLEELKNAPVPERPVRGSGQGGRLNGGR